MDKFERGQRVKNTKTGQHMLVKMIYELHGRLYAACRLLDLNRCEVAGRTGNRPRVTLGNLVAA
jgi:hypothetical protein